MCSSDLRSLDYCKSWKVMPEKVSERLNGGTSANKKLFAMPIEFTDGRNPKKVEALASVTTL